MKKKQVRTKCCPIACPCLCHATGGAHFGMHGDNGRCPTKDGLPVELQNEDDWIWPGDELYKP